MKVIISQEHINKLKSLIEKHGIKSLGIEPYKLIEMGVVESYDEDLWLDLQNTPIKSLGNLKYVDGDLFLSNTSIKNLGNLEKVDGFLDLKNTPIESLGNLKYVGGYLYLRDTPLAKLSDEEIKSQVKIKKGIFR